MNIAEILKESINPRMLGDLCKIKINFPDADFWIQRNGSEDTIGSIVNEFNPDNIGIKVVDIDKLDPGYLKYALIYLKNAGYFKNQATGMLKLKHIRVDSISQIPIGN